MESYARNQDNILGPAHLALKLSLKGWLVYVDKNFYLCDISYKDSLWLAGHHQIVTLRIFKSTFVKTYACSFVSYTLFRCVD